MTLPDRDSLSTYGGAMSNYADPIDPTTDEDAGWRNKYAGNVAMMTHTITRAFRSFLGTSGGATAIADPTTGFVHDAVWGNSPLNKPSVTQVASCTYDINWPSTVLDELDVTHSVSLSRAWAAVESSDGTLRLAEAKVTGAATVRVYTFQSSAGLMVPSRLVAEVITVFVV